MHDGERKPLVVATTELTINFVGQCNNYGKSFSRGAIFKRLRLRERVREERKKR